MTIDERLERLAERHESLTHFVELSSREFEHRMTEVMEGIARVLYTVQQDAENIRTLAQSGRESRATFDGS